MTRLALIGAAVSFAAWAVAVAKLKMENGKWKMKDRPQFSILHFKFSIHAAVFAFFAGVAVQYAGAKHGGTNAPPNGASPPQMVPPGGGNVELRIENVELRNFPSLAEGEQHHNSPFCILHSQLPAQFPTNAVRAEKWWRRGAWEDVMRVEFPQGWMFPFGEGHLPFVDVVSQGSLRRRWTDTNEVASVGIRLALVPFSSVFWHEFTPSNSCRFVWSGALAARPSSDVIGVTATWRGRTWRGSVVFWNDVEESVVSLDGGGTIFVESAYTNYPGETTVRTSTEQKLTAHWALRDYGPVTLSATEGAAVNVRLDSPNGTLVELPYSWYGCPGDVGSQDFYVTNNDPSRAGESVTFTLEFDGEDGDYDSDSSGLLEVVRYRVVADALWPSNRVRHVFGPVETFKVYIEGGPTLPFDAPLTPGECNMSFDYNGSTCTFPIRVIAPSGVAGTLRFYDSDSFSSFISAGFTADVQVLPTYVSFAFGLRIMEGEAGMSGQWGCFKNYSSQYPPGQFAHNEANGALNPLRILSENKVEGFDHVRTELSDFPIEDGGYHMNIPIKWGAEGGPYTHEAGHVVQTVSVQTNGTVSVSKFGITARRKPNEDYQ